MYTAYIKALCNKPDFVMAIVLKAIWPIYLLYFCGRNQIDDFCKREKYIYIKNLPPMSLGGGQLYMKVKSSGAFLIMRSYNAL